MGPQHDDSIDLPRAREALELVGAAGFGDQVWRASRRRASALASCRSSKTFLASGIDAKAGGRAYMPTAGQPGGSRSGLIEAPMVTVPRPQPPSSSWSGRQIAEDEHHQARTEHAALDQHSLVGDGVRGLGRLTARVQDAAEDHVEADRDER
jgi:hypothetical protein